MSAGSVACLEVLFDCGHLHKKKGTRLHVCLAVQGARAQLQAAISARPVNALALQLACEAGRECKLLYKGLLMAADVKLRNIRAKTHPEAGLLPAAPRQQPEPRVYDPRHQHPDPQRGEPRPRAEAKQRGPDARGRPDARQHGDPRQHPDSRQRPEARPHAEPRQQQYVPQQPQYEPHRQHGPLTEARNGRHIPQDFADVPGGKHQRGHANPANPPRKGLAPRNPGAAAAANAGYNAGYNPDRASTGGAAPSNNNAAQSQRSHKPAVKESTGPESDDCVVCWAHEKDVVCIPCGHVAMCKSCSKAVMQQSGLCPVCRQEVREIIQLFRT